jgi:DNA-binding Lrp family transcriptional regulator
MRELDAIDARLLLALARHPRITTVALAQELGLTRNTVQARMASLQADGVFLGYDRSMSPAAIGFPLVAFTLIHAQQQHLAEITAALAAIPEIVQAHGLTGSWDVLVQIVAASAEELFRVDAQILACRGVERTETSIAMSELVPYRLAPLIGQRTGGGRG